MTLVCLALVWLAGFGLVRWMFPQPLRWSLHNLWLFSLGIGMGAGVGSCLYFLVLLLAGPLVGADKKKDAEAIRYHYDVSNDFYQRFLDPKPGAVQHHRDGQR